MTLLDRLRALVDTIPPGGSVTIPRDWLATELGNPSEMPANVQVGDLTAASLAAQLGRKPSTVRGWCERGALPGCYRLHGREWRIPPAAVEAFLTTQRTPAVRGASPRRQKLGDWRRAS